MDQKKIGRFIAELRKEKGMTQKNLAGEVKSRLRLFTIFLNYPFASPQNLL